MTNQISPKANTTEIILQLDHYDDVFSDFDPRPLSKRALSTDFLEEIKRAIYDREDNGVDLALLIPSNLRNEENESVIIERLSAHFKRHFDIEKKEKQKVLKRGISMVVAGIIFMLIASFLVFEGSEKTLLTSFLVVFLEPAAWFLLWEGMDQIIFNSKDIDPRLEFYRKMSNENGSISFRNN